ncbi:cytochrome P450 1A5-like [Aplysia californica]|uniref:unspecific monooxygenase n=1 Tax=Aplysia californica TaxID=6500 RepID=A0ABM1W2W6_APLCA|nr:cytochrome P450 1A5-like [Aplysia californica]
MASVLETSDVPVSRGLCTLAVILSVIALWEARHGKKRGIPGPWGIPVLGNLLQLGRKPHKTLTTFRPWRLAHPEKTVSFINQTNLQSPLMWLISQSSGMVVHVQFSSWPNRIAQNALASLSNKKTNPIEATIASEADVLVSRLLNSNLQPKDPHTEIYLSVGSIICAICFGKRYRKLQEHLTTYDPNEIRDVTDCLIKATIQTPQEEKEAVGLTDEHILTTVQELIGAGFDTIASTLQWAVLYMMSYPDIQEKVHSEIVSQIGQVRPPTLSDLPNLPMTEATLLEVLRHSCIFPFALPHSTTKDTELDGYAIPKDTLVFVNLWSVSRDAEFFQDPEKFDPSRFLDVSGSVIDKAKADFFLPFGAGRRKCPGEQLARMELFMFFARLLQKCEMRTPKGDNPIIDSKYGLTLKPVDFKTVFTQR